MVLKSLMIKIKPSLNVRFVPDKWNSGENLRLSNCYCLAMNAFDMAAVNPGSLNAAYDNKADNIKLLSKEGLSELMEQDGWIAHEDNDIDPARYHMAMVFGYRRMGLPYNDCHFFFVTRDKTVCEKQGIGLTAQQPRLENGAKIKIENVKDYFNRERAESIMPPVYGGLWRMPENGLTAHPRHLLIH